VQAGCGDGIGGDEGPRVLELTNDTIQLADGVHLIDVAVRRQATGDFEPAATEANVGDVIRFTAHDRGGHALVFEGATLQENAKTWLGTTGQLRSPPLISDSSAWVITLKDAPPGEYPFRCTTHAATGRLTVRAKSP
jgi:plastocyanin